MAADTKPDKGGQEPKFDETQNMPPDPQKMMEESKASQGQEPMINKSTEGAEIDPAEALGKKKGKPGKGKFGLGKLANLTDYLKGGGIAKKFGIVMLGIVLVLFIVSLIVSLFRGGEGEPAATPTPTPQIFVTPTPEPFDEEDIINKSPYADEPEVLQLMEDVVEMDKKLLQVNFKSEFLRVPDLEWDVSFSE